MRSTPLLVLLSLAAACTDTAAETSGRPITLRFSALAAGAPFGCATPLALGSKASAATFLDLRFYVSNPALVMADGRELPITLTPDGVWQSETVGLVDLEAGCATSGTAALHDALVGTVPEGAAVGLAFDLGLPFELNHLNSSEADPPLNLPAMFWSWQAGYRFVRFEVGLGGSAAWFLHLGSVGCVSESSVRPPTSCERPNRTRLRFAGFDPSADVITLDLDALLAGIDITQNVPNSPIGCMSDLGEADDCRVVFEHLGVEWDTGAAKPETATAFRVVKAP